MLCRRTCKVQLLQSFCHQLFGWILPA